MGDWILFKAFYEESRYITYIQGLDRNQLFTMVFDTGAVNTVISLKTFTNRAVDRKKLKEILSRKTASKAFRSVSGHQLKGYLVCADGVKLSGFDIGRFYYYLILDAEESVSLLGNDFISCCHFSHDEKSDIIIRGFNRELYESEYEGLAEAVDAEVVEGFIGECLMS